MYKKSFLKISFSKADVFYMMKIILKNKKPRYHLFIFSTYYSFQKPQIKTRHPVFTYLCYIIGLSRSIFLYKNLIKRTGNYKKISINKVDIFSKWWSLSGWLGSTQPLPTARKDEEQGFSFYMPFMRAFGLGAPKGNFFY